MSRKALFFDVDGTLLSERTKTVPRSAKEALAKARSQGHLVFINSGRVICHLGKIKDLVEVDGYLCGCGTYLEMHERPVYEFHMGEEEKQFVLSACRQYGVEALLEGCQGIYFQEDDFRIQRTRRVWDSVTSQNPGVAKRYSQCQAFDKFCVTVDARSDIAGFTRQVSSRFQVIDRGDDFFECVPLGHSKATAIEKILALCNIPLKDAWVFGDSANDLAMFEYVPNAVLMGVHDSQLVPYASFITKTVEEDGVAYAMEKLGILEA